MSKRFITAFSTDSGADWRSRYLPEATANIKLSQVEIPPFWKSLTPDLLPKLKRQLWEKRELAEGLDREVLIRVRQKLEKREGASHLVRFGKDGVLILRSS